MLASPIVDLNSITDVVPGTLAVPDSIVLSAPPLQMDCLSDSRLFLTHFNEDEGFFQLITMPFLSTCRSRSGCWG